MLELVFLFFFSSRRRHTRSYGDWSSDVCSSDLSGGSSASQRALAEEAEKTARQLQQLTREQQRQDLNDAMRRVQDAADAMRRAAANGSSDGGAQANERSEERRVGKEGGARGER